MKISKLWRTAKVFTKAPGFGIGYEIHESRTITIRPKETAIGALRREGFDPSESRVVVIDF